MTKKYLVIIGPTASGKTELALRLASELNGEIVCCDSVQLYQGFDIGSAKPTRSEQEQVKHHLFDAVSFPNTMDAAQYGVKAREKCEALFKSGKLPFVVGGSGLYLRAFWQNKWSDRPSDIAVRASFEHLSNSELQLRLKERDPSRAQEIHLNDRYRLLRALEICTILGTPAHKAPETPSLEQQSSLVIAVNPPREMLISRIEQRTQLMFRQGWREEVLQLLKKGCPYDYPPMASIGYKQMVFGIQNQLSDDEIASSIIVATRQLAKKQRTWLRKVSWDIEVSSQDHVNVKAICEHFPSFPGAR